MDGYESGRREEEEEEEKKEIVGVRLGRKEC